MWKGAAVVSLKVLSQHSPEGSEENYENPIKSRSAIFDRCVAAHWCDAKGRQVCHGSLGRSSKRSEKKLKNKQIVEIRDEHYF
jgi:hypothetical protein